MAIEQIFTEKEKAEIERFSTEMKDCIDKLTDTVKGGLENEYYTVRIIAQAFKEIFHL